MKSVLDRIVDITKCDTKETCNPMALLKLPGKEYEEILDQLYDNDYQSLYQHILWMERQLIFTRENCANLKICIEAHMNELRTLINKETVNLVQETMFNVIDSKLLAETDHMFDSSKLFEIIVKERRNYGVSYQRNSNRISRRCKRRLYNVRKSRRKD